MTATLATLFSTAVDLTSWQRILLILPLCLAVAVVYKTTRCERVSQIPRAALGLWLTIVIGMYTVGAGLLLVFSLLA